MITIDGSSGEGGGQIVRTSLALSICLYRPFRITNVRVKRKNPGMAWQHLAAVNAAAQISNAETKGVAHRSTEFTFMPREVMGGDYYFDIGTAGSTTLVIQTILLPLLFARRPSTVTLIGGTHNPLAPSFEFLANAFLPVLHKMGANAEAQLIRPGFFPKGGGKVILRVSPLPALAPLRIDARGDVKEISTRAVVAGLPAHIAERENQTIQRYMNVNVRNCSIETWPPEIGPGNVVNITVRSECITEVFTGFGQRGISAENVGAQVATEATQYIKANVPVGIHLADQLLLPMVLANGGSYLTQQPSSHTLTNIDVIRQFTSTRVAVDQKRDDAYYIHA